MVTSGMPVLPFVDFAKLSPGSASLSPRALDEQPPFEDEKRRLGLEAAFAAVTAELAAAGEHAVAGDQDRRWVAAAGAAALLRHAAGLGGDFAIAARLAIGDALHRGPDLLLKGRTIGLERQIEVAARAGEIGAKLAGGVL